MYHKGEKKKVVVFIIVNPKREKELGEINIEGMALINHRIKTIFR